MKKTVSLIMLLLLTVIGVSACGAGNTAGHDSSGDSTGAKKKSVSGSSVSGAAVSTDKQLTGIHHAVIKVKDYGTIKVKLDADAAPITVTNFVKLANEGFYNGLTFHRIMAGFMIQGGDPNGDGTGGAEETIKGEFSANGVENNISHERGVISMARSTSPDSASSQFFIMHSEAEYLDGQYAAFGKVTKGMKVVDKICASVQPTDNDGTVPKENQPVIESIVVKD